MAQGLYPTMLRTALSEGSTSAEQRRNLVESTGWTLPDHPRSGEIREILREIARADPSPWVRLAAQRVLAE